MRIYDTYKDSGISWLGQIPSHWDVKRARIVLAENASVNSDVSVTKQLQFKYGEIEPKANQSVDDGVKETISKYTVVEKGDIMINGLNLNYDFISQRVAQVQEKGCITSAYVSLRPTKLANSRYYTYYLKAMDNIKMFHGMGSGVRLTLSYKELKNMYIPIPPIEEQREMANYIDSATAEIDKAIASQQRMVELLQERKQIIINQAVTQGLNPDAPMKPTNINYIGNVPAHWQITQFKRGISKLTDYTANGSFGDLARNVQYLDYPEYSRLIRLTDLRENLKNDKCVWVNKRSHDYLSKSELFGGELLIANVGAYSGYSCIMPKTNLKCTLGPNMELIECNQLLLNEYASLVLNSKSFFNHLQMVAISSAQPKLNKNDIKSIFFLFPPIKEQEEIIEYIKITTKPIDAEITRCEQKIALLTERKQILINDVVTGKIKVS